MTSIVAIHNNCYGFQYELQVGAHETTRAICEIGMVLLGMVDARVNEIAVFGAAST